MALLVIRHLGQLGALSYLPTSESPTSPEPIPRSCAMAPHRADLRGPEPRSSGSAQEAVHRPLANSTSTSHTDQGPEPKPPPSAGAEANHQAVQPRVALHEKGAPQLPAATSGGGSARTPGPNPPRTSRPPGPLEPSNSPTQQTSSSIGPHSRRVARPSPKKPGVFGPTSLRASCRPEPKPVSILRSWDQEELQQRKTYTPPGAAPAAATPSAPNCHTTASWTTATQLGAAICVGYAGAGDSALE